MQSLLKAHLRVLYFVIVLRLIQKKLAGEL
jgi:hypothetical protein